MPRSVSPLMPASTTSVAPLDGSTATKRPLPSTRAAGSSRRLHRAGVLVVALLLVAYPAFTDSVFQLRVFTLMFVNATLAVGLVLPLGLTRLFDLSQGTVYGIGAYTTAVLTTTYGLPFEVAILGAVSFAAAGGFVLGITARRVRGDQWALVSMAATIAAHQVFSNWTFLGGREGYSGIAEQSIFGIELSSGRHFYLLALGGLVVAYVLVRRVTGSFLGRAMRAVGRDEVAAATLGVDVGYHKTVSLVLGSAVAGLAGAISVATVLFVSPGSYDLVASFSIAVWVIVGGASSVTGAAAVAALLTFATEQSRSVSEYRIGLLGVLLIVVLFLRADVVGSWMRSARNRWRRR